MRPQCSPALLHERPSPQQISANCPLAIKYSLLRLSKGDVARFVVAPGIFMKMMDEEDSSPNVDSLPLPKYTDCRCAREIQNLFIRTAKRQKDIQTRHIYRTHSWMSEDETKSHVIRTCASKGSASKRA